MLAVVVPQWGDPSVLEAREVEVPLLAPGEVMVRVEYVGVNYIDIYHRSGMYPKEPPFTPGGEASGVVDELGEGVEGLKVGDRVAFGLGASAYAEYVAVPAWKVVPLPDGIGSDVAAAIMLQGMTAHYLTNDTYPIAAGDTVLVHAAAGGVGSSAVQLGKAAGATVIGTAGGPDKVKVVEELGADVAIDYTSQDFVEVVKEVTGGKGADVVYDPVGGDVFDKSRRCTAWEGRILIIGFTSGRIADAPTNHALLKNYSVVGVHWAMYNVRNPQLLAEVHDDLLRLHAEGKIAPLIGERYAFDDAPRALEDIAGRRTVGKVVVTP